MAKKKRSRKTGLEALRGYDSILSEISALLEGARRTSARSVNAIMTLTYWEIGRRIVESEQEGKQRAEYGKALLERLASDLTANFGRGFSIRNLRSMRAFYRTWPIRQTLSAEMAAQLFPLPWSHYVRLLAVKKEAARTFYEQEAIRGGWSIRQLERQIGSQFYERTALSKSKAAMISKGRKPRPEDAVSADEQIKALLCWNSST